MMEDTSEFYAGIVPPGIAKEIIAAQKKRTQYLDNRLHIWFDENWTIAFGHNIYHENTLNHCETCECSNAWNEWITDREAHVQDFQPEDFKLVSRAGHGRIIATMFGPYDGLNGEVISDHKTIKTLRVIIGSHAEPKVSMPRFTPSTQEEDNL